MCVQVWCVCIHGVCSVYAKHGGTEVALQMVTTLCPFSTDTHNPSIYIQLCRKCGCIIGDSLASSWYKVISYAKVYIWWTE